MKLIEQLYQSGCLDRSSLTEAQAEIKQQERMRDKLEAALLERLDEEGRRLLEEYDVCRSTLTVLYGQSEFSGGFRFGLRLAAESLVGY